MTVTIIGSLSRVEYMKSVQECFEKLGWVVNTPLDPNLQGLPLIQIQVEWIKKIKEADIVVAIPKKSALEPDKVSKISYEFGESTSYEMAIANEFDKMIFIKG